MDVAERMCDRIFMIFRGQKVLDGTLDEIQSDYGTDTVRVRSTGRVDVLRSLPGVTGVNDHGQLQELRFTGNPQALLSALVARVPVRHFEVVAAVAPRHLRAHRAAHLRRAAEASHG